MNGLHDFSKVHSWWYRWGNQCCDGFRWHVAIGTHEEDCNLYARAWAVIDDFGNLVKVA